MVRIMPFSWRVMKIYAKMSESCRWSLTCILLFLTNSFMLIGCLVICVCFLGGDHRTQFLASFFYHLTFLFFHLAFWLGKYSSGELEKNFREGPFNSTIWCDSVVTKQWIDWLGTKLWHPSPSYSGVQGCQKGLLTSIHDFFVSENMNHFISAHTCLCMLEIHVSDELVLINASLVSDHPESRT